MAKNGVGLGGNICGEDLGVKVVVCGVSKPVKTGGVGRSARIEVGCWFLSAGNVY